MHSAQVLIVDDDHLNAVTIENALSNDFTVHCIETFEQGVRFLTEAKYDLIILNIFFANNQGEAFISFVRSQEQLASLPIVIVSSSSSFNDEAKALSLGAWDYITRPFNPVILRARIKNYIELKQKSDILQNLASIDRLTEVSNRRLMEQQLQTLWAGVNKTNSPLGLLMIDIDFFKEFNEHYGYSVGDKCLIKVAKTLKEVAKLNDSAFMRFDGARFVVLCEQINYEDLVELCGELHDAISMLHIEHKSSPICAHISLSVGGICIDNQVSFSQEQAIELASEALIKAQQTQVKTWVQQY